MIPKRAILHIIFRLITVLSLIGIIGIAIKLLYVLFLLNERYDTLSHWWFLVLAFLLVLLGISGGKASQFEETRQLLAEKNLSIAKQLKDDLQLKSTYWSANFCFISPTKLECVTTFSDGVTSGRVYSTEVFDSNPPYVAHLIEAKEWVPLIYLKIPEAETC